jgi:hypothetical protein
MLTSGTNTATVWRAGVAGTVYTWSQQATSLSVPALISNASTTTLLSNKTCLIFTSGLSGGAQVNVTSTAYPVGTPNIFTVVNQSKHTCLFSGSVIKAGQIVGFFPQASSIWPEAFRTATTSGLSALTPPGLALSFSTRLVSSSTVSMGAMVSDYGGGNANILTYDTLSNDLITPHHLGAWVASKKINNQANSTNFPSSLTNAQGAEPLIYQVGSIDKGAVYHRCGKLSPYFATNRSLYGTPATPVTFARFCAVVTFAAPYNAETGTILDFGTAGTESGATGSSLGIFRGWGGLGKVQCTGGAIGSLFSGVPQLNAPALWAVNVVGIYHDGNTLTLRVNAGANYVDANGVTITGTTNSVARLTRVSFNAVGLGSDVQTKGRSLLGQIFDVVAWGQYNAGSVPTYAEFTAYQDTVTYGLYPK